MRAEMYDLHAAHEASHWWYVARRRIVLDMVRPHAAAAGRPLRLLDVGCGAGGLLESLRAFGEVVGVDPSPLAVAYAARDGADVRQGALPDDLPFDSSDRFDVITALDVIEHIDDDVAALASLRRLLSPGGLLVLTVPAFRFLWSGHDVVNEHRRRYTRPMLRQRLRDAAYDVRSLSYFNTIMFPPIAAVRIARRWLGRDDAAADVGAVREPFNRLLASAFAAERHVLRRAALPFGVSLIATALPSARGAMP